MDWKLGSSSDRELLLGFNVRGMDKRRKEIWQMIHMVVLLHLQRAWSSCFQWGASDEHLKECFNNSYGVIWNSFSDGVWSSIGIHWLVKLGIVTLILAEDALYAWLVFSWFDAFFIFCIWVGYTSSFFIRYLPIVAFFLSK